MTKTSTKRSLAMSILSLVLCLAMLIGSTYAWFSDEAETSPVNITAGNLDVEIVHATKQPEGGYTAGDAYTDQDSVFPADTEKKLWEPGMMVVSDAFMVKNNGTLALKYQLDVTAEKVAGEKNLLDVVKYKVVKAESFTLDGQDKTYQDREKAWNDITEEDEASVATLNAKGGAKDTSEALKVVLFWEPTDSTDPVAENNKDNQFNMKDNATQLKAQFTLNVFATQFTEEEDSFGDQYDADAKIPVKIDNNQALEEAIDKLKTGDIVELAEGNFESDTIESIPEGVAIVGDTDEYGDPVTTVEIGGKESDCVNLKNNKISNIRFEKKLEDDDRRPELLKIGDNSGETAFAVENCEFDYSADTSYSAIPSLEIVGPGTVKNCTFEGKKGILSGNVAGKILIEDCTFKTDPMSIQVTGGNPDSHLTINRCTFNNYAELEIDSPDVTMEGCTLYNTTLTVNGACNWKSNGNYFNSGSYIALWSSNITFTSTGDHFESDRYYNGPYNDTYLFMTNKWASHTNINVTVDGELPNANWFKPGTLTNAIPA